MREHLELPRPLRLLRTARGALTTYSTFSYETPRSAPGSVTEA